MQRKQKDAAAAAAAAAVKAAKIECPFFPKKADNNFRKRGSRVCKCHRRHLSLSSADRDRQRVDRTVPAAAAAAKAASKTT